MREIKIRCSSIAKLMTEPKLKSEVLSVGAKTHIRELVAQELFGVDFEISDKKLEKGILVEDEAIAMVGRVRGLALVKNKERRSNDWISGEADIFCPELRAGRDVKSSWSMSTFPICWEDVAEAQRKTYEYQMRGYLWLWDADEWHIDHCLIDTPPELLSKYEPLAEHVVSHIAEHHRVTTWTVTRDKAIEAQIAEKVRHAREYYAQVIADFDRTHQPASTSADPPLEVVATAKTSAAAPALIEPTF